MQRRLNVKFHVNASVGSLTTGSRNALIKPAKLQTPSTASLARSTSDSKFVGSSPAGRGAVA